MAKNASQHYRSARTGQFVVAGKAKDGTSILRQEPKPTNFTRRDAERIVEEVKSGRMTVTIERVPAPGYGDTKK